MANSSSSTRELARHSCANVRDVAFHHLLWTIEVDFAAQQLRGTAEYTFTYTAATQSHSQSPSSLSPVLVLDTHALVIESVAVDSKQTSFELQEAQNASCGRALVIPIAPHAKKVKITYATVAPAATTASSGGLQWLPKERTASKTHPLFYTQCHPCNARSIVPVPNTPAATFTYTAVVTVPAWTTVILSALADESRRHTPVRHTAVPGKRTVTFRQAMAVPARGLAVAAGRFESAELGRRSRVWAEPTVLANAAHAFAQTETYLQYAEALTGQAYSFGRFDVVCLPLSFPYSSVAAPSLTFVSSSTTTMEMRDQPSLAQAIAYAWTGLLVTPATWRDAWLLDAWTTWLARMIQCRVARDARVYALEATVGQFDLVDAIECVGPTHPSTSLVPSTTDTVETNGVLTDDAVVLSEKGFRLLHYISTLVGGQDVLVTCLQSYIQRFRREPLTSDAFRAFVMTYFTETLDKRVAIAHVDWHAWYDSRGMPPVPLVLEPSTLLTDVARLAERMGASADPTTWSQSATAELLRSWSTSHWIVLLETLLQQLTAHSRTLSPTHVDAINAFCHRRFTATRNAALCRRWYTLALRSNDVQRLDEIAQFLQTHGRMNDVRPLYRELCRALGVSRTAAMFHKTKQLYHVSIVEAIERDLALAAETERIARAHQVTGVSATLARALGIPDAYASYSPLAALALIAAVAGTAAIVIARRRR